MEVPTYLYGDHGPVRPFLALDFAFVKATFRLHLDPLTQSALPHAWVPNVRRAQMLPTQHHTHTPSLLRPHLHIDTLTRTHSHTLAHSHTHTCTRIDG